MDAQIFHTQQVLVRTRWWIGLDLAIEVKGAWISWWSSCSRVRLTVQTSWVGILCGVCMLKLLSNCQSNETGHSALEWSWPCLGVCSLLIVQWWQWAVGISVNCKSTLTGLFSSKVFSMVSVFGNKGQMRFLLAATLIKLSSQCLDCLSTVHFVGLLL